MKKNAKFILRLVLLAAVVLLYFGAEALLPGGAQSTAAPQTQSAALAESTQDTAAESTPDGAAGTAQDAIKAAQTEEQPAAAAAAIDEDGIYDTKDEVALPYAVTAETQSAAGGNRITLTAIVSPTAAQTLTVLNNSGTSNTYANSTLTVVKLA